MMSRHWIDIRLQQLYPQLTPPDFTGQVRDPLSLPLHLFKMPPEKCPTPSGSVWTDSARSFVHVYPGGGLSSGQTTFFFAPIRQGKGLPENPDAIYRSSASIGISEYTYETLKKFEATFTDQSVYPEYRLNAIREWTRDVLQIIRTHPVLPADFSEKIKNSLIELVKNMDVARGFAREDYELNNSATRIMDEALKSIRLLLPHLNPEDVNQIKDKIAYHITYKGFARLRPILVRVAPSPDFSDPRVVARTPLYTLLDLRGGIKQSLKEIFSGDSKSFFSPRRKFSTISLMEGDASPHINLLVSTFYKTVESFYAASVGGVALMIVGTLLLHALESINSEDGWAYFMLTIFLHSCVMFAVPAYTIFSGLNYFRNNIPLIHKVPTTIAPKIRLESIEGKEPLSSQKAGDHQADGAVDEDYDPRFYKYEKKE